MIQLTQEALLALIHDASTRRPPKPWLSLRRNTPSIRPLLHLVEVERIVLGSRGGGAEAGGGKHEFLDLKSLRHKNSIPRNRGPTVPLPSRGVEDPYLALAIAPPRRSPFSTAILAKALPAGVKVSNLQNTTEQVTRRSTWISSMPKLIGMT
ncbi:UNVERIFIED_CONTAM: hypothetical protein Sradi_0856400 [Sesamum radiatum]|uniref:Uncharacterized protein n=1 Tax=Sesamum radiatum TaxID=300843 RepID=A0AAW2V1M8_SESRA